MTEATTQAAHQVIWILKEDVLLLVDFMQMDF